MACQAVRVPCEIVNPLLGSCKHIHTNYCCAYYVTHVSGVPELHVSHPSLLGQLGDARIAWTLGRKLSK